MHMELQQGLWSNQLGIGRLVHQHVVLALDASSSLQPPDRTWRGGKSYPSKTRRSRPKTTNCATEFCCVVVPNPAFEARMTASEENPPNLFSPSENDPIQKERLHVLVRERSPPG